MIFAGRPVADVVLAVSTSPWPRLPASRLAGLACLDRIALITGNAGKAAEYAAMLGIKVRTADGSLATEPRGTQCDRRNAWGMRMIK